MTRRKSVFVRGDLQVVFAGVSGIKRDPVAHAQAINQTLGVMTDKADEAKMREGAGLSFVNNIETFANQYGETRMGSSMFSYLVGYEDPRLMKYFKPSDSRYAQNVPFAGAKYQALPTGAE